MIELGIMLLKMIFNFFYFFQCITEIFKGIYIIKYLINSTLI